MRTRKPWAFRVGRTYTDKVGRIYVCAGLRRGGAKVLLKQQGDQYAVLLSEPAMRLLLQPIKLEKDVND